MRIHSWILPVLGVLLVLGTVLGLAVLPAAAQGPRLWINSGSGDWNYAGNWANDLMPDAFFGDSASITNGGTATLTGAALYPIGGVLIGPGSLEMSANGSLDVVDASDVPGAEASTGFFSTATNGILSLADNATLAVAENATLNGTTTISGPNVSFSIDGNLNLGDTGNLNLEITHPTQHSVISLLGTAALAGTLHVSFGGGVSPSLGDTWTIIDSGAVSGYFRSIDMAGGGLGLGQIAGISQVSGGNGVLTQLAIQQRLVLEVNRETGAASIRNPGAAAIAMDGYTIESLQGTLLPSGWSSFASRPIAGWEEVPSTIHGLGELEKTVSGSYTFGSATAEPIGSLYNPLADSQFGAILPEDLVFTYRDPNEGVCTGVVDYVGTLQVHNLVLTVDPASGNAQVRNASPTKSIAIDGYTITSASGSLLTSFDSSLPNSEWAETAGSANGVGELNFSTGATTLNPGDTYEITGIFAAGGVEDLVYRFRYQGGSALEGDFNSDGQVDRDDLTDPTLGWIARFGADLDGNDFLLWQRNFGSSGSTTTSGILTGIVLYDGSFPTAAGSAIPEPAAGWLFVLSIFLFLSAKYSKCA
ncbi:MAG: hypothetical protein JW829_17265 [Pirellulales bacterium]|nr:hypothetical protein [Pirellulales bacterium]